MVQDAVTDRELLEAEHERVVRADIEDFRRNAEAYTAGQLTDDQFRAVRLRRGIYGQRQPGVHMVRTKIPSGMLTARQVRQLALIADKFGGGKAHLTTRQNVQYHFVPLARVPDLLHTLADVCLTSREACYNTVRNVTADPLAGLLPDEPFDVRPYARQVAFAFLHKSLTDAMPRKFKIAFSGRKTDAIATQINDVGLRAMVRFENGVERRGFRVSIGGGLGPMPVEAKLLDEFLPVERLVNRLEAVLRVFNQYGNRKNKNIARLKFVVRERGFDWVKEQVEKEYADILANGGIPAPELVAEGFGGYQANPQAPGSGAQLPVLEAAPKWDPEFDRWLETNVEEQKQPGYAIATIRVPQGNLTGDQLRGIASLAEDAGDGTVRVTMDQDLVIAFVAIANLKRVYASLRILGLAEAGAHEIDDIITCPGAYSCNLALTKSMNLGAALADVVNQYKDPEVRKLSIKISGCPNSCGQHWIGDIGFYGNARKIDGKEVPYYQLLLGGGSDENNMMRFGLAIQSIPARFAPVIVKRVLDHFLTNHLEGETFREYVVRNKVETFRAMTSDVAKPAEMFPELYKDWGDEMEYSLKLGRGECAG